MSVLLRRAVLTSANVNLLYPALAFLLTVFAVAPLGYPGFFQSYTGYGSAYNLIEFHAHLPAFWTWSPDWGHPYDLLRMDGPLGYWIAELGHLAGLSFLTSIKLVYALAFLVSGYGMFRLARRVFRNEGAALLASTLYVYFPAHIAAVYVRGAFGEAVAWALFPLVLEAAIALDASPEPRWRDSILCLLPFAGLALAQPGLAILFGILTRVWLLVLSPRTTTTRRGLLSPITGIILVGLGLGIAIQLPAILQHADLSAPGFFVPAYVLPFQLLSASWGTDLPRGTLAENAPYQIGLASLGLTILAVALLGRPASRSTESDPGRRLVLFAVSAGILLILLMMPFAAPGWDYLGLNLLVQYPFQLLAFVGFFLTFSAAWVVVADVRFQELPLLAALLILPMLAVYPYLAPEFTDFSPTRPALARFNNDELALLDAKIVRPPGTWRHGATVELDLTWQALQQPNRDYTVFLHMLDDNGNQWGGTDEKPQGGTLSTLKMLPGRVYSDTHTVQIDLNGPPEGYHLEVGIYQTTTGERATTETGADFVRIDDAR